MRTETMPEQAQWRKAQRTTVAVRAAVRLLMFSVIVLACATATAQTPGPDGPPPAPAGTPAPPPASGAAPSEGFFDAFGNWVQQGVANAGAGFGAMVGVVGGQASQAAKGAADAARSAATMTRLPVSAITGGRERCTLAPNGAPDCRGAAEVLCRAKGYGSGTSVDFETVEKCPPAYRASRRNLPEGVCTMEHFVTKALCQ